MCNYPVTGTGPFVIVQRFLGIVKVLATDQKDVYMMRPSCLGRRFKVHCFDEADAKKTLAWVESKSTLPTEIIRLEDLP